MGDARGIADDQGLGGMTVRTADAVVKFPSLPTPDRGDGNPGRIAGTDGEDNDPRPEMRPMGRHRHVCQRRLSEDPQPSGECLLSQSRKAKMKYILKAKRFTWKQNVER